MLLREAGDRCDVFMVRRNSRSRFLPEAYVFPGGTLERQDFDAEPLNGGTAPVHSDCTLDEQTQRALSATALREVAEECGVRLHGLGALTLFSHWRTPESEPQRYDVHFFVAPLPTDQQAAADGNETENGLWIAPGDALARSERGSLLLYYPTRKHLERLASFRRVRDAIAFARSKPVVTVLPTGSRNEGFALPPRLEDAW